MQLGRPNSYSTFLFSYAIIDQGQLIVSLLFEKAFGRGQYALPKTIHPDCTKNCHCTTPPCLDSSAAANTTLPSPTAASTTLPPPTPNDN